MEAPSKTRVGLVLVARTMSGEDWRQSRQRRVRQVTVESCALSIVPRKCRETRRSACPFGVLFTHKKSSAVLFMDIRSLINTNLAV